MLKIEIDTSSDVFGPDPRFEVHRILSALARAISDGGFIGERSVPDANGNTCGTIVFVEDEPSPDGEPEWSQDAREEALNEPAFRQYYGDEPG